MASLSTPGFFWFLVGEGNQEECEARLHNNNNYLHNLCTEILYSDGDYNIAFQRFYDKLMPVLRERDNHQPYIVARRFLVRPLIYFYNRQFITQMMCKPFPFPTSNIHIPIDRSPSRQLIVDILALSELQVQVNYNLPYLVVIVDAFSRFVWAHPVGYLDSESVKKAFFLALSRPGLSNEYYSQIRDNVTQIVVDGGSEFKKSFPTNIHFAFPHAILSTSQSKSTTGGRPTNAGPVEAAIGMLRRVIRKYEWTKDRDFFKNKQEGLTQILDFINNATSQPLHRKTPVQIAEAIINNDNETIHHAQVFMDHHQTRQIQKKTKALSRLGNPENNFWIVTNPHGSYAYRLYLPPKSFSKLVTVKVTKELYVIKEQNVGEKGMQVELQLYGENNNDNANNKRKIVNWQQLVLVRAPVDSGPPQVQAQLMLEIKRSTLVLPTPHEVSQPFHISPEITAAIGQEAPHLELQLQNQRIDRNPIQRNRRVGARAPAHLQDYQL